MRFMLRTRALQLAVAAALMAGGGIVTQSSAGALTGGCDITGSSPGVHIGADGYAVFGTEGDDVIVARGDCFTIDGFGGNDRITFLAGGYVKHQVIYGGPGDDRICTRNGYRDTVDGGPGHDKVLADPRDIVVSATEVNHLNCS
ncbi:MAG TPA: hypothetical protein VHS52_08525 [Acidimicrobiales bacterium]|jgi:hypothetical protein|nr:hypothetical protein [Acidimicrobiales bacterium]